MDIILDINNIKSQAFLEDINLVSRVRENSDSGIMENILAWGNSAEEEVKMIHSLNLEMNLIVEISSKEMERGWGLDLIKLEGTQCTSSDFLEEEGLNSKPKTPKPVGNLFDNRISDN